MLPIWSMRSMFKSCVDAIDCLQGLRIISHQFDKNSISEQKALPSEAEPPVFFYKKISFEPILDLRIEIGRRLAEPRLEQVRRDSFGHSQAKKHEFTCRLGIIDFLSFNNGLLVFLHEGHIASRVLLIAPSLARQSAGVGLYVTMCAGAQAEIITVAPVVDVMA